MAISNQIQRLTTLRNNIRTKLINLGILPAASTSATLSECYNVLSSVTGLGASSYTPTTVSQVIPSGRYLSGAQTINAIPSAYIIPSGTVVLSSSGTFDVGSYASADVTVTGGPSGLYVDFIGSSNKVNIMNISNVSALPSGMAANLDINSFDCGTNFSTITSINVEAFYGAYIDGFGDLIFPNVTSSKALGTRAFYSAKITGTTLRFDNIQTVSNSAESIFASCITGSFSLSFTNLFMINGNYFCYSARALKTFYAPKLKYVYANSTFQSCWGLTRLDFPELSEVYQYVFYDCHSVSEISMPKLAEVGQHAFERCSALTRVELPNLEVIRSYAFMSCSSLERIDVPMLTTISGDELFYGCRNLKSVVLPAYKYTNVTMSMFTFCSALSLFSAPATSRISGTAMFSRCVNLVSLFFLGSSVCALGNTIASMFSYTPISTYSTSAGRWGSVFVPASLLAQYKAATNWTTISSKIFAYEDYFS